MRNSLQNSAAPEKPTRRIHIHMGEHYISSEPGLEIVTILGSCIGVCIRDPLLGLGGMNHFMMPGGAGPHATPGYEEMQYGLTAMERLINGLLSRGARRDRLEVKVFGGAAVLQTGMNIGQDNITFVRHYLAEERMPIAAQDVGGDLGRRIHYVPQTGKVMRLRLDPGRQKRVFTTEVSFRNSLKSTDHEGSVELFS
jgi:chemotaxis protein CheD